MRDSHNIECTAWSPCGKFIAIGCPGSVMGIQILDAMTLNRIKWIDPPQCNIKSLTFSAENHLLGQFSNGSGVFTSWDLETGYPTSSISIEQSSSHSQHHPIDSSGSFYQEMQKITSPKAISIIYSECGTMFGVLFKGSSTTIAIYQVSSGMVIHTRQIKKSALDKMWIYEKHLRYATFVPEAITIWEVGFTPEHPPIKVESLPVPSDFDLTQEYLFLPTLSQLAFIPMSTIDAGTVRIWDAQHSKFLLDSTIVKGPRNVTFSTDGHFFACGSGGSEIYLWKGSPTGYYLYQTLISSSRARQTPCKPLLSPDGQVIIASAGPTLQMWHTTDLATSPIIVPNLNNKPFIVEFSLDESLVASAQLGGNIATVVNLKSGVPQLSMDTGMKIYGLRAARGCVVIVGSGKIVTWSLPMEDCSPDTGHCVQTVLFDYSTVPDPIPTATISPDFNYVVFRDPNRIIMGRGMQMYHIATGWYNLPLTGYIPYFTPNGQEVWCHHPDGRGEGCAIAQDSVDGHPQPQYITQPQLEGCPWLPLHGYIVVDAWLLDSKGKQLLWLPPPWRSQKNNTKWSGQFLAFLNPELPDPVILELLGTSQ